MLSISLIKSAAGAAKYFTQEDSYYLSELDTKDLSMWQGKGAEKLGLQGKVDEKTLQSLLEGKLPNGKIIGLQKDGSINHRPGYDICFSAPKSISILTLDGGDKRLYRAHIEAVLETLQKIERDCAQAKIFEEGKIRFENTKNITAAIISHALSRKLDPQLHCHALVMNATERNDGQWRAQASCRTRNNEIYGFAERYYHNQLYYGAIYKAALANKTVALGYAIEKAGPHGMWEIKGVPLEAKQLLSKRRQEISNRLTALNYKTLKAADYITLDTRDKKEVNATLHELKQVWHEELLSVGFSSKDFIQNTEKNKQDDKPFTQDEISKNAMLAVQDAIDYLSQYKVNLDYAKIEAKALEFSIGKNTHQTIVSAIHECIKRKELIPMDPSKSTFVTKELIDAEKQIMNYVNQGKEDITATKINYKTIRTLNIPSHISDLTIGILQSRDRLNLIDHFSGDTQPLVSAIVHIAENSGKTVKILSPNRLMANDTNNNIKRKANSLWQWLIMQGRPALGESVAGFNFKYQKELNLPLQRLRREKDVIVVDDAEKLGRRDMQRLLELTDQSKARVIFLNDLTAKKGFTAGNPIETLKQGGIKKHHLLTTNITRDIALNEVKDEVDRHLQIAKQYSSKTSQDRINTTVIAGSKAQVTILNKTIRDELKNQHLLGRTGCTLNILNPVSMNRTEKTLAAQYKAGAILRFYDEYGRFKDWKINRINKDRNILLLQYKNKTQGFNPKKNLNNFSVFHQEALEISTGDKLLVTAKMKELGLNHADKLTIQAISEKQISFSRGNKISKINLKKLDHAHLSYDYATTLEKSSKKPTEHLIANFKGYALDSTTISELKKRSKSTLTIFTNDAKKASKRFLDTPVKLTATETILKVSKQVDRLLDKKAVSEIKNDIEKAISILTDQSKEDAAQKAVDFAMEKITSRNAGFTHKELVQEALVYALNEQIAVEGKQVTEKAIMKIIADKQKSHELIMGKYFSDGTRWTTKEALALEKNIITTIKAGSNTLDPLIEPKKVQIALEDSHLTNDQKSACLFITTTKDQYVTVQGYAGTGKTTMFQEVQKLLEPNKIEVIACAPTHRAVRELQSKGINAQTLKSFLVEQGVEKTPLDNKLIILDEASMVSNKDFSAFTKIVKNGNGRVVFSGDIAQHIAIESGKPYEMEQKTGAGKVAYLRDIVRQKNPAQKQAVQEIIRGDYHAAFTTIEAQNPKQYIKRNEENDFFDKLNQSIVEIDNNKSTELALEKRLAEDFLTRTPEMRENTAIIVHANKDRKLINDLIREGLKLQGEIAIQEEKIDRLISKGLTHAEYKSMSSYNKGDVIKLGRHYYTVEEKETAFKSILLRDEAAKTKRFYPEKYADRYRMEIYEHVKEKLAPGDIIRLTKTDKERKHHANFEYAVTHITDNKIVLESKVGQKNIELDTSKLQDTHWDYAYTVTGYGIQGASKQYVIDYEVSYRKNLASQRSFYIGASRAEKHLMIYTNNKTSLIDRILANKGDKYAALEVVGEVTASNNAINSYHDKYSHQRLNVQNQTNLSLKEYKPLYDAKSIEASLKNSAESVVKQLLGEPNQKLSTPYEWRYGNKGSLAIKLNGDKRGVWYNFETNESGNLLGLLQTETGLTFKETLQYAANLSHSTDLLKRQETHKIAGSTKKENRNTNRYAQQLISESQPIKGTPVETYLTKTRGLTDIDSVDIRYHPRVFTSSAEAQKYMPAMLAIGRNKEGEACCVQATYLTKDGQKADVAIKKRSYGPISGHTVTLQNHHKNHKKSNITFVAEGVETGLSIKESVPKDDVLVTLGKSNFVSVNIQNFGQKVVLCIDNDGPSTFKDPFVHKAAQRLIDAGRDVYIAMPKQINNSKTDFNDITKRGGVSAVSHELESTISYQHWKDNTAKMTEQVPSHNTDTLIDIMRKESLPLEKTLSEVSNQSLARDVDNPISKQAEKQNTLLPQQQRVKELIKDEREIY